MILAPHTLERLYEVNDQTLGRFTPELEPEIRMTVARCPFALFDARFSDSEFWRQQHEVTAIRETPVGSDAIRAPTTSFAQLALFFAWHLVHSAPSVARLSLGMADGVISSIETLRLDRIQAIATHSPQVVAPRWSSRSPYWKHLLQLAQRGSERRIEDMKSLGLQLMAAKVFRESRSPPGRR